MKKAEELLTTGDVAVEARVVPETVRLWESSGRLPCLRTRGGQRLFRRGDVDRLLEKRRAEATSLPAIA